MDEYSPSLFSRTTQKSMSPGLRSRSGEGTPGINRTGRMFAYCRKPRRMGMSRPHSETWSGTPGKPTAPRKMASCLRMRSRPSAGIISPCLAKYSQLQGKRSQANSTPNFRPAASSRSEEHTSELQSHSDLVCRRLLEKKKKQRRPQPVRVQHAPAGEHEHRIESEHPADDLQPFHRPQHEGGVRHAVGLGSHDRHQRGP